MPGVKASLNAFGGAMSAKLICLVAGCALIAALVALRIFKAPASGAVSGPNGFYVWQRHWSDKVEAAVSAELEIGTHDVYLLGGELEYEEGRPRWRGADVPVRLWRHSRVASVFRLPVQALDDPDKSAAEVVSRAAMLGVSRIQLDVDVPESMIVRYAELVERIRVRWPSESGALRLGATFLPCHLGLKDIRRVLAGIDEPVIQLHGIDAPKTHSEAWSLMKRKTVFRALRSARTLDGRFKMALPSYAYVLTFNADGSFRRLYAEGLPDDSELPHGVVREIAAPDLGLLHEIFKSPLRLPVIWFRLPVRGVDRWCLERETLSLLERGELPEASVEFAVRSGACTGTVDLVVRYRHQIPIKGVAAVIDWGTRSTEGEYFALNGSGVDGETVHGRLPSSVQIPPFACGEEFVFGKAITQSDPREISIKEVKGGQ